ncbi:sensor histidine kinase [Glutamicibacter endophyticus]
MSTRQRAVWWLPLLILTIVLTGSFFAARRQDAELSLPAVFILLASAGLLAARRRAPGYMVAAIGVLTGAYLVAASSAGPDSGFVYGPFALPLIIALVLAIHSGARWWAWGTGAGCALLVGIMASLHGAPVGAWFAVIWILLILLAAELARSARMRRRQSAAAAIARVEHRRDEQRLMLARDIHDVVAHSLSMIHVQASVALHLAGKDPDPQRMAQALREIKAGSSQALAEVRQVLAVLRQDAPLAPGGRLRQLPELVESVRGEWLEVQLEMPTEPRADWLDERAEHALYRAVQEGLTNVLRHAKAGHARVQLSVDEHRALLEVRDDGIGLGDSVPGNGLRGLGERVRALGGEVELTSTDPGTLLRVRLTRKELPDE